MPRALEGIYTELSGGSVYARPSAKVHTRLECIFYFYQHYLCSRTFFRLVFVCRASTLLSHFSNRPKSARGKENIFLHNFHIARNYLLALDGRKIGHKFNSACHIPSNAGNLCCTCLWLRVIICVTKVYFLRLSALFITCSLVCNLITFSRPSRILYGERLCRINQRNTHQISNISFL